MRFFKNWAPRNIIDSAVIVSTTSTCRKSLKPCLGKPVNTRAWNSSSRAVRAPPCSRGDWISCRIWGRISLCRLAIHDLCVLEIEVSKFKVNWKKMDMYACKKKRAYCFEKISLPLLKDKLEIWYWVFISRNLNMEHNKQLAIFRCVLFYRHVDPWPETHEGRSHWWAETSHSWLHRSCWRTRTPLKKTGFMHWLITVIQYNVLILFSIDSLQWSH